MTKSMQNKNININIHQQDTILFLFTAEHICVTISAKAHVHYLQAGAMAQLDSS